MLLTALYVVLSSFAARCQPDGDHVVTCQTGKCETVGDAEICTECKAGGVPVSGFCWPPAPPRPRRPGAPKQTGPR